NIKFIFQPAEEGFAGAKVMVEEGVLKNPSVDGIIALHVNPKVDSGIISHCEGPATANSDKFDIRIIGEGGHAAHPHLSIDSITIATTVVNTMQQIVSRSVEPLEPVVLTFGKIEGGFNHNIIAPEVKLSGTVRTLNLEVRDTVKERMESYLKHICEGMGAKYEFDYRYGYPAVFNDPELTPLITDTVTSLLGEDYIDYSKPTMGGEDFSYFTNEIPGVIFKIGTGTNEKTRYPLHHPMFDLDEKVLPIGVATLTELSLNYIKMLEEKIKL
ncbi:MAG TPA: M20 family metallopeptidase, partial [Aliicoccus persicus]|nr:M20 family metallopeptidase [Aliicoccus persicus]